MKQTGADRNIRSFCANFCPEESLKRVQEEPTQENKQLFLWEIKNARFLVPCIAGQGGKGKPNPVVISTQQGEKFLPAFSDLAEFEKWPFSGGKVSVFSFDDLKHRILMDSQNPAGIAVNPFGEMLLLRQSQIAQIDMAVQGMSVQCVKHTELRLWCSKGFPPGLAGRVKTFFRQRRKVHQVYLLLAQGPEETVPHWLFIIDFDGTENGLFPEVAEAVQPYMKVGDSFELMKATSRLLRFAAAKGRPIYQCANLST